MWCRHCQQDVPAIAPTTSSRVQCARCQKEFGDDNFARPVSDAGVDLGPYRRVDRPDDQSQEAPKPEPARPDAPIEVEPRSASDVLGADSEDRLENIGRQLRSGRPTPLDERKLRLDAVPSVGEHSEQPRPRIQPTPAPTPRAPSKSNQVVAWIAASLGALTLGAGLGMLGWALFGGRADLWNWGLGATLTGQGLMIVGLVQLLASLWTAGRDATNRLIALHYEIRRLQRTADGLAGMRNSSPSAFYADLARGSSPQVMIANLKGQVDELAARYSRD